MPLRPSKPRTQNQANAPNTRRSRRRLAAFFIPAQSKAIVTICADTLAEVQRNMAQNHGEELIWTGLTQAGVKMYFFANFEQNTYTVFFSYNNQVCTAAPYSGKIIGNAA